ncbi:integrin alpha-X-like [Scleropages formosus]|uniref:Integrin alpha-X-like n=1 Tax=Scleropages formosus TaxID=113540 RepID=A0A0P7VRW4_SCLFO|nr:integrin alpha-X-like [Scleropages formosus]
MQRSTVEILQLVSLIAFLQNQPQTLCFSVDTEKPRVFGGEENSYFGHRVCHFGATASDTLLVTAPLFSNATGGIYRCSYRSGQCDFLSVEGAAGTALGLSLTCDARKAVVSQRGEKDRLTWQPPHPQVCGPHLKHDCQSFRHLNGLCVELDPQFAILQKQRPAFQECRDFGLDAVILFDDSQSISRKDFETMISFIKNIVGMFTNPRLQVAVAKYSTIAHAVFHFENFAEDRNPENLLHNVQQTRGQTHTPSAIRFVLYFIQSVSISSCLSVPRPPPLAPPLSEDMMVEEKGMRPNSKKLLVVITDGHSNDPKETFDRVIPLAEQMGVTRYAIGVGKQYSRQELEVIASSPRDVFETESFDALSSIQKQLSEKIFAIEGTGQSNFTTFQLELSQGGFSTALVQETTLFGTVGAYEWSGGIVEMMPGANGSFINASAQETDMKDSYLGYSVAVAQVDGTTVYFAGAPRYLHTGLVLGFQWQSQNHTWTITHRIRGMQLGSYFGAELCALDVSGHGSRTHLLLVGAPEYHGKGVGGEVRICPVEAGVNISCPLFLRGVPGAEMGRFGAAVSPVPDLNGDGFPEVAVGAPLEVGGRGSVYIFLGRSGGLHSEYSQRILGTSVDQHLRYFGVSVHSAGDLSADGLPDLVIGSRAAAVVLRSHPVMCVATSVTFDPPVLPSHFFHCAASLRFHVPVSVATVCVAVTGIHTGSIQTPLQAQVSVSMELDAKTKPARLLLSSSSWSEIVSGRVCRNVSISIPVCVSDYSPVPLTGRLSVQGQEVEGTEGLKAVLSPDCPTTFSYPVFLEQVCGEDQVCVSDLQVSLSVSRLVVVRSPEFLVNLPVRVFNHGEDGFGPALTLVLPSALSFVRATKSSGAVGVRCTPSDRSLGNRTHTVCQLSSAVLVAETSVENVGESPVPLNLSFTVPVDLGSGLQWNISLPETDRSRATCTRSDIAAGVGQPCTGTLCQHIGCIITLLSSTQPIAFNFSGAVMGTMKIYTVLEETPPIPTALIAVGVSAALVLLAIVFVVLYKRGFFKPRFALEDQNGGGGEKTSRPDDVDTILDNIPSGRIEVSQSSF